MTGWAMGTCELCGIEGVGTKKAKVSSSELDCCNRCISSNALEVVFVRKTIDREIEPISQITGKGVLGIDIMSNNSKELAPDFHLRIRKAREQKEFSTNDLARRINEKVAIIQKAEDGARPTDALLEKISKELGIELFFERSSENYRQISNNLEREMTISDLSNQAKEAKTVKKRKKKSRKLGVSRGGPRKRS